MTATMNVRGMLKYDSIDENLTIDAWGTVTNSSGKALLYGVRGIYSDSLAFDGIVDKTNSRIHANDLELKLQNGKTITVKNYFLYNGGTAFNYIEDKDSTTTSLLNAGFIENKNKYNEYNLATNHAEDGLITKTYIQGTAFKDTVDLSGFDSDQLKYANGVPINQLVLNTENGDDTITGSIINDYIIGGNGNNTLDYSDFIAGNKKFGDDTYALTYKENVNIKLGTPLDSQVITEKVGGNIEIKVFSTEAETQEISYEKTVVSGDTTATKYTKTVTEGDTVATKYEKNVISGDTTATKYTKTVTEGDVFATKYTKTVTEGDAFAIKYQKYEVVANSEAEAEGEHAGKYEKVTKVYVRNSENNDWELASTQPDAEYVDTEVAAEIKYTKSVNGTEGEKTEAEPENYNDEGAFNKTVKVFSRNDDNTDWKDEADSTENTLVDTAVIGSEVIKKSVNGAGATVYTEDTFIDEGAFNKTVKVFSRNNDNTDWNEVADSTTPSLVDAAVIGSEVIKKSVNGATATKYSESDFSDEGKFNKTVNVFSRNEGNTDWNEEADSTINSLSDTAITGDTIITKSINGGEATEYTEEDFTDEGKFNKTVKVFDRKDDNSDWKDEAASTDSTKEDTAITASTIIKKSINGDEATEYTGSDFSDEDKFNKATTVYNYNGVRDLTQADIADSALKYVDNNTVSKTITTAELSEEKRADGYTVVEGKLHHDAVYRAVAEGDIVEGKIFVPATETTPAMVKDTEEGEPRAIVASDIKEDLVWVEGSGIQTAAATDADLAQADLATGWTIAEDKINATRALTSSDLTEAAQVYEREAETGKLVLWDKIADKSSEEVVDAAVSPDTSYVKIGSKDGESSYEWNDSSKPTDMGTQKTGETIVNEDKPLGKIVLPYLGANNDFASVKINGTDIFDSTFYINAKYGGYVAGIRADEVVELDQYPTYFAAQNTGKNGYDAFFSDSSTTPNLTYANYQYKLQDLVADFDSSTKNIYGDAENKTFSYSNSSTGEGVGFNNVNATIVDKSGAAYNLSFAEGKKDYSNQWTNNLVYAKAQNENEGVSVSTGVYNDVVAFGSAAADVTSAVTESSPNLDKTKLVFEEGTLKYEKTAAKPAEYRNVTSEDLVDGRILVDPTHVKESEDGESRAIVDTDIKEDIRSTWSAEHGIETAAAVDQELVTITADNAAAAINGVSGYAWDADSNSIKYTTENVNKVTYTSGNDAFLGSTGKEQYDIASMNGSVLVTINDLGGNDLINFTNKNFSDMTMFFDVNKDGEAGSAGLTFVTNDIVKSGNPYYTLSFLQGKTNGGVIVENFFKQGEQILDNDNKVLATAKGNGYIENIKVSGSSSAGSIDSQISQITQNVIAWLDNNGNYDSAMEVVNAGNANDIQSLVQCYTAGTTFVA